MTESNIQRAILDYLQYLENLGKLWHVRVGSGKIDTKAGNKFHSGKPGCPDILVCVKGRFVGLEVKTDKGRLSKAQVAEKARLEATGGRYEVIRSIDDVIRVLEG